VDGAVSRSAIRKIYWRLLPIAIVTYFLAYIDRINVGFAALTMCGDLRMSATDFGFASGIFFWGYFLLALMALIVDMGRLRWLRR
jgi:ACS family tartrate transporter-like MFS transporter